MNLLIGCVLSYLIGSIPTAYIFGRLYKNIDIRQHGSGNVGATNVFRVLGQGPGMIAL
ncbi:MAG: acyl-phosphate glycerol 3-phosphate acyltransferase, partial [Candidatus Omnitrophica bacterium CG12_big_fil_rev_8_21_14_0_65_50_5]